MSTALFISEELFQFTRNSGYVAYKYFLANISHNIWKRNICRLLSFFLDYILYVYLVAFKRYVSTWNMTERNSYFTRYSVQEEYVLQ